MNRNVALGATAALALFTMLPGAARADYYDPQDGSSGSYAVRRSSLDDLVASIALYPDPLLAQLLPAATFPDQVREAARLVDDGRGADPYRQDWDESVAALTHYPSVLQMMADRSGWTADLGDAYLDNPDGVMDAIQRFREEAYRCGNLVSNREQEVVREDGEIRIWPAQADVIYVPRYDPVEVCRTDYRGGGRSYDRPSTGTRILENLVSFGAGLAIGSWLNHDFDWHRHQVYHHGWQGAGWVGRSRGRIHLDPRFVGSDWRSRPVTINRNRVRRQTTVQPAPTRNTPPRRDVGRRDPVQAAPARPVDPRPAPQRPYFGDRTPGRHPAEDNGVVKPDSRPGRRWNGGGDGPAVRPDRTPPPAQAPTVRRDEPERGRKPVRNADPAPQPKTLGDVFRNLGRQQDRTPAAKPSAPPAARPARDGGRNGDDRSNSGRGGDRGRAWNR